VWRREVRGGATTFGSYSFWRYGAFKARLAERLQSWLFKPQQLI